MLMVACADEFAEQNQEMLSNHQRFIISLASSLQNVCFPCHERPLILKDPTTDWSLLYILV